MPTGPNIERLIITSPYEEPRQHYSYVRETRTFALKEGRRSAGYIVASVASRTFDDPGIFIELPLINQIRSRVKIWREAGYPGVTGITKRLLDHWRDPLQRPLKFFFCQLEAMETLIWLAEAPASERVGITIPSDGGPFLRLCSKMATGSGKTIDMAMLIAWQAINKATYPQDARFSKNFLVVSPGLTVKSRLQVLAPSLPGNYYEEFGIVPPGLQDKLRQARVLVRNWQVLAWETEEKVAKRRSVDKRGPKSNEAYVREVLGEICGARNIVVINDEAHHAWRLPSESKVKGLKKEDIEEATKWVGGLDKIHQARGILACYDFTATPFAPSGKKTSEEALFSWIVSDFGLNDAIESGLVKTPRVVVRDDGVPDAKDYRSKLYHIYEHVRDDLSRKAAEHDPLPDLVLNGYYLLGKDWLEAVKLWESRGIRARPVMITVANRTETAARIKYAFDHKKIHIDELYAPERTLHIDSNVLEEAESQEAAISSTADYSGEDGYEEGTDSRHAGKSPRSKQDAAEYLRQVVDTVGKEGKPGEKIQNVISVGMLSEGWDVKTVTHIMGLRAFSSQLLCEQVVGRGLRRTSYEINPESGLFDPEYVNIFGVPFTFLPHESTEEIIPQPPSPKTRIEPDQKKERFLIQWPNIIRIDHVYRPELTLDLKEVTPLEIQANETLTRAEMAKILDGKPDITDLTQIDLEELGRKFRMQRIIFETASEIFDQMNPGWKANKEVLLSHLIRIVEDFIASDKIQIHPALAYQDDVKRRIIITLNMNKVVQHIWESIRFHNSESVVPVFDVDRPIRSTGDMRSWYTGRPNEPAKKSHINFCVYDSTWEASESFELDQNPKVEAWVKNDHLGFEISYIFQGLIKKYWPDYIIRLNGGVHLVLEVKGIDAQVDKTKRRFLDEWIRAVNAHGGFGSWAWAVSRDTADVSGIIGNASCSEQKNVYIQKI
jgi:type III restriction enzyme